MVPRALRTTITIFTEKSTFFHQINVIAFTLLFRFILRLISLVWNCFHGKITKIVEDSHSFLTKNCVKSISRNIFTFLSYSRLKLWNFHIIFFVKISWIWIHEIFPLFLQNISPTLRILIAVYAVAIYFGTKILPTWPN